MKMFRSCSSAWASIAGLLVVFGCSTEPSGQTASRSGNEQIVHESAQEPVDRASADQEPEGKVYGGGVTGSTSVTIAQLLADPDAYVGRAVQVEGTITDVCPKRGCWFDMAGQKPGEKMRFKVDDGVMVFPMDAKGKHAVAEGVVSSRTLSLEETRQYLAYQAKEYGQEVDPESVHEPMTIVRLEGTGAVLRERN